MTIMERIERGELIVSVNRTVSELPGVVHAEDKSDRDELLRLARIGEREQWVAVSDGLPEPHERVMIYNNRDGIVPLVSIDENGDWVSDCIAWTGRVDYWRYMPQSPGGEKND